MKNGDKVKWSDKNANHLGNAVCAYAGYEGTVEDLGPNGFVIKGESSTLVIPLGDVGRKRSFWIWVNGKIKNYI